MKERREIILASASKIRRRLLESAGVVVRAAASAVDEAMLKSDHLNGGGDVAELPLLLATAKAERISAANHEALVIGADQVLVFEGRMVDKPGSLEEARGQLLALRGKTHCLISAVAVARDGGAIWTDSAMAELSMRWFGDAFLATYLSAMGEDALTSVGSYKIEGRGIQLFDEIRGDYFTILGLPMLPLLSFLRSEKCLEN
jgi:septum formation protein